MGIAHKQVQISGTAAEAAEARALLESAGFTVSLAETDPAKTGSLSQIPAGASGHSRPEALHPTLQALRESDDKFSRAFHISPDSININRLSDGVYIDINEGFTRITGYTREETIGRSSLPGDLNIWVDAADRARLTEGLRQHGEVIGLEANFRTKDGRILTGLMSAKVMKLDGIDCILSFTRDISVRKQAELERDATIRLLSICNQAVELKQLAREITLFFKKLSGCETVGLYLREGGRHPYFETRGTADEFVAVDKHPCAHQCTLHPALDDADISLPACFCNTVMEGRANPSPPWLTPGGGFWTGTFSKQAHEPPGATGHAPTPDTCGLKGSESVALIPLRSPHGTTGLLLIQDRRRGTIDKNTFGLIEMLAQYVTVAFEKLLTKDALQASEQHLNDILQTFEAGYFFIDPSGRYKQVNRAWLEMHGFTEPSEVVGRDFSLTQVETDLPAARAIINDLIKGVHVPPGDFTHRRKDGSIGHHTFSAHAVKTGGRTIGIEGFLIDTSKVHAIREQHRMLFEQLLDGFALHGMIYDAAGNPCDYRFLAINPAFQKMTGLSAGFCIGRTAREILPGLEEKWVRRYGKVVSTGTPKRFEDYSRELNKHFEIVAFRPAPGQFACLIRDISDRKQLELQLLHTQKMEAVGQLAGGVAHDFNNFLAAIMIHLNLLQRTPGMGAEVKASLKELESEAKRASSLTRQLLMFSRRQVVQLAPTDLNELLSHLIKMLRRILGEQIKIVYTSEAQPLWLDADPGMLEQVVMNLCVNARDAMPRGGELSIQAERVELGSTAPLGDTENRSGAFARLSITDTGCGMNEETLVHIFKPFFTTKEPGKGTGLGLATVYSIVKQHRGWIHVRSTPGRGSVFRIFFPAIPAPASPPHATVPIPGGSESILVVEDDTGFRNLVAMSLKLLGYRVYEATTAQEARAIWNIHRQEIGLLLADQVLPGGTNGHELCQQLKAEKPALRLVITTGYLGDVVTPAQLEAEDIVFLPKPFTAENLASTVRRAIDNTQPGNQP